MTAIKLYSADTRNVLPGRLPSERHHSSPLIMAVTFFWHSLPAFKGFPGGSDVKNLPAMQDLDSIPGLEDPMEKGKATHSSILSWRIPWTVKPIVSQRQTWLSDFHSLTPPPKSKGPTFTKEATGCNMVKSMSLQTTWDQILLWSFTGHLLLCGRFLVSKMVKFLPLGGSQV